MKKNFLLSTLWVIFLTCYSASYAAQVETSVKYIAESAVYLDAGRANSVQVGDNVRITRDDKLIAVLEIVFVSDKSSSCKLLESISPIQVGDKAVIQTQDLQTPAIEDTIQNSKSKEEIVPKSNNRKNNARRNIFSGRIAAQLYTQNDLEIPSNSYSQPSYLLNGRLSRIGGGFYSISVRLRARRNNRDRELSSATQSQWNNRLYEAALEYDNPGTKLSYSIGRILNNSLAGIGYLDGLSANYKVNPKVSLGVFGGTVPDAVNTDFQTDELKSGVYANYTRGDYSSNRFSGTLAFAGNYHSGEVSREFIYQQADYSLSSKFYLYESAELNINRDWLKKAEGSSLKFSNLLLNTRYSFTSKIFASLSYDNRRNFHTFETKTIPDSLFDGDLKQGLKAGVSFRFPQSYYTDISGGLRGSSSDFSEAKTFSIGTGNYNFLKSQISLGIRFNAYSNTFANGYQPSLSLSKYIIPSLSLGLEAGNDRYDLKENNKNISSNWLRMSTNLTIERHWYSSASFELQRGGDLDANRLFLEAGYRF